MPIHLECAASLEGGSKQFLLVMTRTYLGYNQDFFLVSYWSKTGVLGAVPKYLQYLQFTIFTIFTSPSSRNTGTGSLQYRGYSSPPPAAPLLGGGRYEVILKSELWRIILGHLQMGTASGRNGLPIVISKEAMVIRFWCTLLVRLK